MSRSAMQPLGVGATAPEALSLLHQRIVLAKEGTDGLIRDMDKLGISRDHILGSAEIKELTQRPVSPLKMLRVLGDESVLWQKCESLVSQVCRMESLLQTLKLTIFRLETERELDPSHTAHLKQQLSALQQESEEEQQTSRRELMKLQDQLQQANQERDEARMQVERLGETLEAATAARMDVALAAEELKIIKIETSQKLMEMKEQMRQESVRFHGELLQRVEEAEGAVEMETRQALLLQSRSQTLCAEVQSGRQQLVEEKHRGRQLEECCQLLRQQTAMKDSLLRELKTELKKQQAENGELLKESRELRAAADRVQAERSRAVEQLQEQDLLLDTARRSIQTELQVALADNDRLEKELEKLKAEHTHLLQSSAITQETAVTERKLLQRTAERLQGELSTVRKEEAAMRKDLEGSKNELSLVVTKLEAERNTLDAQLREARQEVGFLSSTMQNQQDENKRLMGKVATLEQHQISELQAWQSIYGPAEGVVSKTLDDILASRSRLQLNSQTLHQEGGGREEELATLKQDRLQAHREIRKHQAEVEKLQRLLTSAHCKSNRALESLQKALVTAREDNKRLALSLEQTVLTNSSLHRKMDRAEDQYRATITQRDDELREARTNISYLSTDLSSAKQQSREDYESSMKTLQREVSELKMTVKDSSTKSSDVSKTNQELHRRACELERLVSRQKACIREQRSQLRRQQESRELQDGSRRVQGLEERTGSPHEKEHVDRKLQVRVDSEQVLSKREAERERWTSTIQRWEAKRELARTAGGDQPVRTKLITQSHR